MTLEERFINGEINGMLFTTPTCGFCPAAKQHLSKFDNVEIKDATTETELVSTYRLMSVPTLVLANDGGEFVTLSKDAILKL